MQKKEFIRQLNELVPRPDPVTTEALYRFDRECAETEYIDMLTALRVVARNFSEETLQSAYEIIQNQNAALPSELFTAASTFRPGAHRQRCPVWPGRAGLWASLARSGRRSSAGLRPAPLWSPGREQRFYNHGLWALQSAACLEAGHHIRPGNRHIRHPGHGPPHHGSTGVCRKARRAPLYPGRPGSELTEALFQISSACPAVAAHITCHADLGITEIAYHPLWLERSQSQAAIQQM